jgi:hypothetical protein
MQRKNFLDFRWGLVALSMAVLTACGGGEGAGAWSPSTGGVNTPPSNVRLVEASSAAIGALSVSWLPASDDTTPATALKYQVHASTETTFAPSASTLIFEGQGVTSASITSGLTAGKSYTVRLVVIDGNGATTASDGLQVTVSNISATPVADAEVRALKSSEVSSLTNSTIVLQAGLTAPAVGTFVSSSDANNGLGYLRKVVGVTKTNGIATLQTQPASINEVVRDIEVSSTFKMDSIPSEVAASAVQGGLAVAGANQAGNVSHTFNWPQSGLRYVTSAKAGVAASPRQLGVVVPANSFKATNNKETTGSWGKVAGMNRIEIAEGSTGTSKLILSMITDATPWNSSTPVGICKVTLGAMRGTGNASNPSSVGLSLGDLDKIQTVAATGRIKVAHQALNFSAAKSTATDQPYKVTVTAYFDDVGDGCNGGDTLGAWRETIDFELEIFVTTDAFPTAEEAEKTFTGSADFNVKNKIVTTFAPKVTFDKTISGARLTYARMGVQASPRVEQILTIEATAKGEMDKTLEIINPRKFFKVYVTPAGIPIVVSGTLRMDMRIKGNVNGELHATEKLSIGYDDISFGLEYKNGDFVPFKSVIPVYSLKVAGNGKAEADLVISLLPSLEITGYEVLTGKIVLEPYLNAAAGIQGHVQLDAEVNFDTLQPDMAADADYRLTQTRLGGGLNAWLYADFHVWEKTLLVWPSEADKDKYESYKKVELIPDTTIMDLPALSATLPTGSTAVHPQDSCAIKVSASAANVLNPLHSKFPSLEESYIRWQRWTAPRIVAQLGVPSDSYSFLPDPSGEEGVFWARMTKPGTYTVRVGGYSNWGTWARQYTEIEVDATDANGNGIPDWWESRYGLTGTGASIASGDTNGNGKTNLQEWQQCTDPTATLGTLNALPQSPSVLESVAFWISDAYQTVKTVVWNFGAGIANQTAAVVNGISEKVSATFDTAGEKIVTATFKDGLGNTVGQQSTTVTVSAGAAITGATSDSATQPGPIANNGTTDDTTPTLTISATLTDSQKINVYNDSDPNSPGLAVASGANWTFTPTTPLIGGAHSFTVQVVTKLDATPVGSRSQPYVINVLSTDVTSVTPGEIMRTVSGNFDIVGRDLPTSGLSVTVPGDAKASCQTPTGMTASGFKVACKFYKLGAQTLEIRTAARLIGTVSVTVKTNVTGVTWTSPSTTNSGTVKFGETVTYKVAGVNLLADATMGFAVEKCGVSNTEIEIATRSNTLRTFTCYFNNEAGAVAGQMPGVVKDAPGGQVLFDGWNVPVEVPVQVPVATSCGATVTSTPFSENFSSSALDTAKWSIDSTGGSVVQNWKLTVSSNGTDRFPYIQTKANPFPASGDFSFYCKAKYLTIGGNGDGPCTAVQNVITPGSALITYDSGTAFSYWNSQYGVQARISTSGSNQTLYTFNDPAATLTHEYETCVIGNTVSTYRDGVKIGSAALPAGWIRPANIFAGNPVIGTAGTTWSSFEVNKIEVRKLSAPQKQGSFQANADAPLGTAFTVPSGVTSCTFNATGTWRESPYANRTAIGGGYEIDSLPWVYPSAPAISLIAKTSNGYTYIGDSNTLTVSGNEIIYFGMNDLKDAFSDNSGALDISWSCK